MRLHYFALILLIFIAACNTKNFQPASGSTPHSLPTVVDKTTAGAITGIVSFKGTPPRMPPLDMTADAACPSGPQPQDVVSVKNGRLANVFVYIKDGLGHDSFSSPSEPVVLDQKGCRYVPHVLGVMVGQPLRILNDDNAEHNIHPMPRDNREWNESQMPHGQPIVKTFQAPEIMMPIACNQHPWMKMYVNVLPHPYFAVSGDDGSFQIKDLPPGEYTLAAVHEKFGEKTIKIKVDPKQTAKADFDF